MFEIIEFNISIIFFSSRAETCSTEIYSPSIKVQVICSLPHIVLENIYLHLYQNWSLSINYSKRSGCSDGAVGRNFISFQDHDEAAFCIIFSFLFIHFMSFKIKSKINWNFLCSLQQLWNAIFWNEKVKVVKVFLHPEHDWIRKQRNYDQDGHQTNFLNFLECKFLERWRLEDLCRNIGEDVANTTGSEL